MLRKLTRTALVFAALATGALGLGAATATPAAAGNFSIGVQIGPSGVQLAQYHRGDRRNDRGRGRNVCNPEQALNKASRLGINRARLVRANRNAVVIDGRSRGRPVTARFAQARGCPLIAYR